MGTRRMLTKYVTDNDNFMELSASAQALYLHLNMSADDDGFNNQVALCIFKAHASINDLESLLKRRYIYQFENGVIVIKHWRMANALRKDRYTPTIFQEELRQLGIKENGSYTMVGNQVATKRQPSGNQTATQVKLSKVNLSKDNNVVDTTPHTNRFVKPTLEELQQYCDEKHCAIDIERFYNYYESNGWKVGKNAMKDWKATVRNWAKDRKRGTPDFNSEPQQEHPKVSINVEDLPF